MGFMPFAMERWMSKFEQEVDYNLSESGVHPVRLSELLARVPGLENRLREVGLNYPYVNGNPELRERIAALYPGAGPENVLVTVGAAEANFITATTLAGPGDEVVVMLPNYMQIWGIAHNHGMEVKAFHLREEVGWTPDLDELREAVTSKTKFIAVCNPNNPTGHILTEGEMEEIVRAASRVGAWIIADEVYAGTERERDEVTPSFWGRYDRVVAVGGLSKAYGLPGLRLGWVVAPAELVDELWARHEYVAISATMVSNLLAAAALSEEVRPWLIARTRNYIRRGFPVLKAWIDEHGGILSLTPPQAAAIAFVRYHLGVDSGVLAERLRREKGVLVVPGEHFGMEGFLRISFGLPRDYLISGLSRIGELISELSR